MLQKWRFDKNTFLNGHSVVLLNHYFSNLTLMFIPTGLTIFLELLQEEVISEHI